MATFYEKMVHLVGEGGWELFETPTGDIEIEWNRQGNPPSVVAVNAVPDSVAEQSKKNRKFNSALATGDREKALITWIAGKHGITYGTAITEIRDIWENL